MGAPLYAKGFKAFTFKVTKGVAKNIWNWRKEGSFDEFIYVDSESSNISVNSGRSKHLNCGEIF